MKNIILTFCLGLISFWGYPHKKDFKVPMPVCYYSNEVHRSYIEPPYELLKHLKSTGQPNANIIVYYDDEFEANTEAKDAFEAAVKIWEGLLSSPVPIYLYAFWDDLDAGALAGCYPWDFYDNMDFMPKKDTYYPVALVEKMMGEEITNEETPDMVILVSTKIKNSFYFGTDGKTPANKYDFFSVILHELGHGLGYTGMARADTTMNTGGFGAIGKVEQFPGIFDQYLANKDSKFLTDTSYFKNPSTEILSEFESESLVFRGQIPYEDGGIKSYPRIYSPSKWDRGSSLYHLNDFTYPWGSINSLMTPFLGKSEAIHDPGPMSLGILYEMGWKFLRIKHEEQPDIEKIEDLQKVVAFLESDYTLDSTKLYLISSKDNFVNIDTTVLKPSATLTKFEADLPLTQLGTIKYYISASNQRNQTFTMPGIAPEKLYSVTFGEDVTAPSVKHVPISFMRYDELSAQLTVEAKDNIGIGSVKVEYFTNANVHKELVLQLQSKNIYKGTLQFEPGSLVDGDSVQYRIIAEDTSVAKIKRIEPSNEYYKFYIEGIRNPVKEYMTDFNKANNDFITTDFHVQTPEGFDDGAFHTIHPYEPTGDNDVLYQYTAELKHPIIIKNGGMVEYDEVVLVEPGDPGSVFGGENYWDYVIVEGSKNNGKTWLPLIDGYDSGANISWKVFYSAGMSGDNSLSKGKKSMLFNRKFEINGKKNFAVGDTIIIRFRMESDAAAYGWGWCIDNLDIQNAVTAVDNLAYSPGELTFYPNPVDDILVFQASFSAKTDWVKLSMYNNLGQKVMEKDLNVTGNRIRETIDTGNLKPGLYFVSVDFENGQKISRKIVKK